MNLNLDWGTGQAEAVANQGNGGRRRLAKWMLPLLCLWFPALPAFAGADKAGGETGEYQPGDGWTLPHTDLTAGGYASSDLTKESSAPWTLDVSHLSLFLWWAGDSRFRFFSETDLENALTIRQRRTSTDGAYLALERLYADWTQSDALNFRVGKYLTPIGRWNLIHAAPLVWTTSRPVITEQAFPTNATGAMVYGTLNSIGAGLDYSVYGSIGKELRPDPQLDTFKEAYGVHISYPLQPSLELGFSYASYEQAKVVGDHKNLIGLDGVWSQNGYEISAEAAWRTSSESSGADEKGGYIQAVAPLGSKFYAVGRYEYLRESHASSGSSLGLVGVDYRWNRSLIIKTEFSKAEHSLIQEPGGFLASVAALF
jgi:hypothetical protein